jgi:hypothetical protein
VSKEWLTSSETIDLVREEIGLYQGPLTVCTRAHAGLVKTRALLLSQGSKTSENAEIPKKFWWADGEAALTQDWRAGDFSSWIGDRHYDRQEWKAFGVEFLAADIYRLLNRSPPAEGSTAPTSPKNKGGRPQKAFWEDLWVEIARQLFLGDLKPERQADIEKAMLDFVSARGEEVGETTVRDSAKKLWKAIDEDGNPR